MNRCPNCGAPRPRHADDDPCAYCRTAPVNSMMGAINRQMRAGLITPNEVRQQSGLSPL